MIYIINTLGCKVNQYETQAMETILQSHGHRSAENNEKADVVIVNTCAVTAESGRKSRNAIRRLSGENPGAVIGVCGCYSQLDPDSVREIGARVIYGTGDRLGFVNAIEKAVNDNESVQNIDDPFKRKEFENLPAGALSGRTRAMLKIQDGCVNFCTYCIIPYTRGRLRSLSLQQAAEETKKLKEEGYKEIVLTGIEIASYGRDLQGHPELADVIETVCNNAGEMRVRLGSLEPTVITPEFCQRLASCGKMCRHFHLSLQSGCDRILKLMNRKYDTARFMESVMLLREYFPGCALTADLITGFPGETDIDHAETIEFITRCGFSDMHVFPYSRRPGTPADSMPGQCSNAVKTSRAHEAQLVADRMHNDFLSSYIGKDIDVLFESVIDGLSTGHTDTYIVVRTPESDLHGQLKNMHITGLEDGCLNGMINIG